VLAPDGSVFEGANVENASYGLTVCAERVAIFNAVAAGHTKIDKLAVSCLLADPRDLSQLMPCGACLQVMREFMEPDAEVLVDGAGSFAMSDLLPRPFSLPFRSQEQAVEER
jgi:cytidine deaminase